jgi:hypothetical protein
MQPLGRKHYKTDKAKHHIKGCPDGGWWVGVIEPSKTRSKLLATREMELELSQIT